jgi:acylphosphatase
MSPLNLTPQAEFGNRLQLVAVHLDKSALVSGEPEALAALEHLLAIGPPEARVTEVQARDETLQTFSDFVVA